MCFLGHKENAGQFGNQKRVMFLDSEQAVNQFLKGQEMKSMNLNAVCATLVGLMVVSLPAVAEPWVGTADYTQAPGIAGNATEEAKVEEVGPFDKYDFGAGVVLLEENTTTCGVGCYDGYYQSYLTNHELNGSPLISTKLNNSYEITVIASFQEVVSASGITVTGGTVSLQLDTTKDRNFGLDTGFSDGYTFLTGTIVGGSGTVLDMGSRIFGATELEMRVDSYDAAIFEPDTIIGGDGIFTLRLGFPTDANFLNSVSTVMGHSYSSGDLKFAADGNLNLVAAPIPEMEQYSLILLGFGLVGVLSSRRRKD